MLASLDAKNIDSFRSCIVSKLSIFACSYPICIQRLRLILQQDLCLVSICFALFVVNNAQREFRHTNMSSDLVLLSSMKMNLNDTIPYFQEVGGVSNHLISYKLWNISSRYIVSHHFSNWFQLANHYYHSICYSSQLYTNKTIPPS